jgi:hypothetical protein
MRQSPVGNHLGAFLLSKGGVAVVQFRALYEVPYECEHACDCQENEMGDRVQWHGEVVEPPGIHVEECDGKDCDGCWLYEIDGPLPFFW